MNKVLKYFLIGLVSVVLIYAIYLLGSYLAWFKKPHTSLPGVSSLEELKLKMDLKEGKENEEGEDNKEANLNLRDNYSFEIIADNLFVPWSLVFTNENRLLVSERNGYIKEVVNDQLNEKSLIHFEEVSQQSEEGLMGLALDPDYKTNQTLYACLAYQKDNGALANKVISLLDNGSSIERSLVIIDNLPSARYHAGCRLMFLPDRTLLITVGDAAQRDLAQSMDSLAGKILRINKDGSVPEDNPFYPSPIYSLGHRNPQGLAYDGVNKIIWSSEHGPSVFDGPAGGDEINIIEPGNNYGWPLISHEKSKEGLISPLIQFTPATAPGSLLYYDHQAWPEFRGTLLYGALRGEALYRLVLNPKNPREIIWYETIPQVSFGRIREVVQSPGGAIYLTTSNRDGRGSLRANDDKIYRLKAE